MTVHAGQVSPTSHRPPYPVRWATVEVTLSDSQGAPDEVLVVIAQAGHAPHYAVLMRRSDAIGVIADVVRLALTDHLTDSELVRIDPYQLAGRCALTAAGLIDTLSYNDGQPVVWQAKEA